MSKSSLAKKAGEAKRTPEQLQAKREELRDKAIKVITENMLIYTVPDVITAIGVSTQTWYSVFRKADMAKIPEYQEIQEALTNNRTKMKVELRSKMMDSKSAAALIALYRIVGTQEERNALNMNMDIVKATDEKHEKDNTTNIKLEIV